MQNFLTYCIPADKMSDFKILPSSIMAVKSLSMSECIEIVKSGVCERFLRRFAVDYVPSANGYWGPVHLTDRDLLELMKTSGVVMVTYDGSEGQEVSSFSYAEPMLLKTRLRNGEVKITVVYFGTSLDELVEHARAHLSHCVAITRGRTVGFMLNFPTCIDRESAAFTISKEVTRGLKHVEAPPTAHVSSVTRDPVKLLRTESKL